MAWSGWLPFEVRIVNVDLEVRSKILRSTMPLVVPQHLVEHLDGASDDPSNATFSARDVKDGMARRRPRVRLVADYRVVLIARTLGLGRAPVGWSRCIACFDHALRPAGRSRTPPERPLRALVTMKAHLVAAQTEQADFRTLFETYYDAVDRYCLRRLPIDAAADAACETFAVAWRRIDDLSFDDDVLPWLYGLPPTSSEMPAAPPKGPSGTRSACFRSQRSLPGDQTKSSSKRRSTKR